MPKVNCPFCGFSGHAVCPAEDHYSGIRYWKYVCEQPLCKRFFVVDTKTGKSI